MASFVFLLQLMGLDINFSQYPAWVAGGLIDYRLYTLTMRYVLVHKLKVPVQMYYSNLPSVKTEKSVWKIIRKLSAVYCNGKNISSDIL